MSGVIQAMSFVGLVLGTTACRESADSPVVTAFVAVDEAVRLEVIDWGGTGRPVILLAGSGNTAHVFDEFAPRLRDCCHVYAITRRGFGASSRPDSGYDDQRLADDVLAVIDALHLTAPVLVGHSMAGGEMTTLGSQHFDRLGGLVYLDALADPRDATIDDPAFMALFNALPSDMRTPPASDYSSFAAYRAAQLRGSGFAFPESELREGFVSQPDGSMGSYRRRPVQSIAPSASGRRSGTTRRFEYPFLRSPHSLVRRTQAAPTRASSTQTIGRSAHRPIPKRQTPSADMRRRRTSTSIDGTRALGTLPRRCAWWISRAARTTSSCRTRPTSSAKCATSSPGCDR